MSLDNFRNRTIIWDTVNKDFPQPIQIMQGDVNARTLLIKIIDNGLETDLSGHSLKLTYQYTNNNNSGFVMIPPKDLAKGEFVLVIPTEMTVTGVIDANLILLNENLEQVIVSKNLTFISDSSTVTDLAQEVNNKIDDFTKLLLENMPQVMRSELNDLHVQTDSNTSNIELKAEQSDLLITNQNVITAQETANRAETILKNRTLQTNQASDFFRRLRSTQDSLKIACIGDSLTYGYDITSNDKRAADTALTDNGTPHVKSRASQTYPEALQEFLNVVYPNRTTVRNMGYSGDDVNTCMQHWNASGTDLAIIMLGTNDTSTFSIDMFIKGYRALISRELESGTSVLLITPPKRKNAFDEKISSYRNAVIELAKEMNIPYVDMASEMANLDQAYYSDTTHFNGKGYRFIGAKVLAILSGESILNPKKVNSTYLSLRNQIDGFQNIDGGGFLNIQNKYPTPAEITEKVGLGGLLHQGKSFFYSFYAENDNTVIYPSVYFPNLENSSLTLMLDFNVQGQAISNSNLVHSLETNLMTNSTVIYDVNDVNFARVKSFDKRDTTSLVDVDYYTGKCLIIPKKGFHTVKVTNTGPNDINFFGLYVTTLEEFYAIKMSNTPNRYDFLTNKDYQDGIELPVKKINVRDLMNVLRTKINYNPYADNPTLKISIRSFNRVHVVYYIHLMGIPDITSTIMDPPQIFKFKNYSGTDYRTLIGVEWEYDPLLKNGDLANLVLKFGGNTAIQSFISIEVG